MPQELEDEVAKRKQAELALRQVEDTYRRTIDAAGAVPYILSHGQDTFNFIFIGEGIFSLTGYTASEFTAEIWNSLREAGFPRGKLAHLTFEEADRITNQDHSMLWECDFRIRTRTGETRWIADTSLKRFDEKTGNLLSIGMYQDITDRKLAEETQNKLIRELEQRNAELERLAYTLSHELKSPLITIRGFLGYLYKDAVSGNMSGLEKDFQRITDGTEKMLRLINELINLMSVGRITHEFKDVALHELANEAVLLVQEKFANENLTIQIANDLPQVYGDPKQLLEVLQNLLENSVKFMGEQPEPHIEIGQRSGQDSSPVFYVRDNGIGIAPRFQDRIFGIFQKLDIHSEGTGVGLALVKRIIEVHHGAVWVESEGEGKGSTFCFTIPGTSKQITNGREARNGHH